MSKFSRFDFRPQRTSSKHSLPPPVRYFNRLLILGLILWGSSQFIACLQKSPLSSPETIISTDTSSQAILQEDTTVEEETLSHAQLDSLDSLEADTSLSDSAPPAPQVLQKKEPKAAPEYLKKQGDSTLAKKVYQVLQRYKPYGAFYLMVDLSTNEVLAWGQYYDSTIQTQPTWLSRPEFPAASLIKMVTASAAMETGRYGIQSNIPQIGRSTTLYSRQLRVPENYQGHTITLQDAFAKSVNPAMALIGLHLGGRTLIRHALKLGFNVPLPFGTPRASRFMPPDTGYAVAEAASGFTDQNTISPLHAAAIVRGLILRRPVALAWSPFFDNVLGPTENTPLTTVTFHEDTYYGMGELLRRTVSHGTAAKQIRKTVYRQNRRVLEIGGKTGTLDGKNPSGRYDWFAGYARHQQQREKGVIIVVMQIHDQIRTLPSSGVAGVLINHWAKQFIED